MTDIKMRNDFTQALRNQLASEVVAAPRLRRPRRWVVLGIFVAAGTVLGGSAALAATIWHVPGTTQSTTLSAPSHFTESGTATVALAAAPTGTNSVSLDLVCLSPGTFTFADGASVDCAQSDIGTRSASTTYELPAKAGQKSLTITASPGAQWALTASWTTTSTTKWGTNSHGETYGAQNSIGTPELIAVIATNGRFGYVFAKQLADADGTTASQHFTSPSQAIAWQKKHEGKTTIIPVYKSDGTTRIGSFKVGG